MMHNLKVNKNVWSTVRRNIGVQLKAGINGKLETTVCHYMGLSHYDTELFWQESINSYTKLNRENEKGKEKMNLTYLLLMNYSHFLWFWFKLNQNRGKLWVHLWNIRNGRTLEDVTASSMYLTGDIWESILGYIQQWKCKNSKPNWT